LKIKGIFKYMLTATISLLFIFPIYFMIVTSISSKHDIEIGSLIPTNFDSSNWIELSKGYWISGIRNSLIISLSSVVLTLLVGFPAAYIFSRLKFTADKHLFFWLLTNRMAPPICFILAYIVMFRSLGLWDTIPGVVLAYSVFNIPIGIWLLVSFFSSVPREIDEQAFIDGFSMFEYWKKIFIPVVKGGIAVCSFFVWMFSWTEMLIASTLTSAKAKPLTVQLLITLGRVGYGVQFGLAAAAGVMTIVPGLALIYWARLYLAKGFTFGRL